MGKQNMALFERTLRMLAPYAREEKPPASPPAANEEDPRLKRLEAQIEALTQQLAALGKDRQES